MDAPSSLFDYGGDVFRCEEKGVTEKNNEKGVAPWEKVNHALVAVGYGVMEDKDDQGNIKMDKDGKPKMVKYWKIKNSWGPTWGNQGYFYLRRGNDDCGIESMAVTLEMDV